MGKDSALELCVMSVRHLQDGQQRRLGGNAFPGLELGGLGGGSGCGSREGGVSRLKSRALGTMAFKV